MKDWNGKRVLILGAARQGLALARWLSLHGAHVTLSDMRSEDELRVARESLAEFQIHWALGGHPLELLDSTDVLCPSGGGGEKAGFDPGGGRGPHKNPGHGRFDHPEQ